MAIRVNPEMMAEKNREKKTIIAVKRETNETSNSREKPILALITLYSVLLFNSHRCFHPSRCSWMLLPWRVQPDHLFTANNDCRPTQTIRSISFSLCIFCSNTYTHRSFDDNWAFYYALKELFNIVFHKFYSQQQSF